MNLSVMWRKEPSTAGSTEGSPTKGNQPARNSGFRYDVPLKVAIAYQDVAAALCAKAILERLTHALEPSFRMDSAFWSFAALEIGQLHEEAVREAAKSDLIVISAHQITEPPPVQVRLWIEQSVIKRERRPGALVVLDDGGTAALPESPVRTYLHQAAQMTQLDLFVSAISESDKAANLTTAELAGAIQESTSFPDVILNQRGVPRWGINE